LTSWATHPPERFARWYPETSGVRFLNISTGPPRGNSYNIAPTVKATVQLQYSAYGKGYSYNTVPMVKATVTIQYLCMVKETVTITIPMYGKAIVTIQYLW
jgi:hypothetical protein